MVHMEVTKISEYIWEVPKRGDMLVPGRIYGNEEIVDHLEKDVAAGKEWNAIKQIRNVASLPGIIDSSLAMPDVHPGYGFPIGGVAAFDLNEGVISVAGVGFDINCGVRTISTHLTKDDVEKKKKELADELFKCVPAGLGSTGDIKLNIEEIDEILVKGAEFSIEQGYGFKEDLDVIEERGKIKGAGPENVSTKAKQRQFKQIGTLGSGNHYLEVQYVDEIYDEVAAKAYGLEKDQILFSTHCGSRALGHQIGSDYLKILEEASRKYKIPIREKELVCAPFQSEEGQKYLSAVNAGINCAFANRQALAHLSRIGFSNVFGIPEEEMKTLYEVAHNTCKVEEHNVNGEKRKVLVHRKGSTRSFGPGHNEVPAKYRKIGQPVLIGGTMGTYSFILHGTEEAMNSTFGSACHGAGRVMSRVQAKRTWRGETLLNELANKGIIIKGHSNAGIAEEAPGAYKDAEKVINVMHETNISRKVARMRPLIVVKG